MFQICCSIKKKTCIINFCLYAMAREWDISFVWVYSWWCQEKYSKAKRTDRLMRQIPVSYFFTWPQKNIYALSLKDLPYIHRFLKYFDCSETTQPHKQTAKTAFKCQTIWFVKTVKFVAKKAFKQLSNFNT